MTYELFIEAAQDSEPLTATSYVEALEEALRKLGAEVRVLDEDEA